MIDDDSWRTTAEGKAWSVDSGKNVVCYAMKSGTGLNAAAKAYGVPKATLKRHLLGSNKTARGGFKQLGRSTDLPVELDRRTDREMDERTVENMKPPASLNLAEEFK